MWPIIKTRTPENSKSKDAKIPHIDNTFSLSEFNDNDYAANSREVQEFVLENSQRSPPYNLMKDNAPNINSRNILYNREALLREEYSNKVRNKPPPPTYDQSILTQNTKQDLSYISHPSGKREIMDRREDEDAEEEDHEIYTEEDVSDILKVELADGSHSHLFRHASEITRETKGGYLQGKIRLPQHCLDKDQPVFFRLSLVPSTIDIEGNPFHMHPNLLHINMRTNKKTRKLQDGELPDDVDWQFIFKIQDEDIYRVCPPSNPNLRAKRFTKMSSKEQMMADQPEETDQESRIKTEFETELKQAQSGRKRLSLGPLGLTPSFLLARLTSIKDGCIELGNTGLMLNIITPLQKFSKGGTTLTDVVRQRFRDLFHRTISSDGLSQVEDVFTKKKEDRIKLQQVCLLVEIFDDEPEFTFRTSDYSDVITNSKSKECGPLQLHDVNPAASCCQSETKIFILSFFKLVADVRANFVLYDPSKKSIVYGINPLMSGIQQPKNCSVFNQTVLVFKAPKQRYDIIENIQNAGLELHLAAFRPSDKKMSSNSFPFRYVDHPSEHHCTFCQVLGKQSSKDNLEPFGKKLPIAKPGVQRRIANLKTTPKYIPEGEQDPDVEFRSRRQRRFKSTSPTSPIESRYHEQEEHFGSNPYHQERPQMQQRLNPRASSTSGSMPTPRMPMLTPKPTSSLMDHQRPSLNRPLRRQLEQHFNIRSSLGSSSSILSSEHPTSRYMMPDLTFNPSQNELLYASMPGNNKGFPRPPPALALGPKPRILPVPNPQGNNTNFSSHSESGSYIPTVITPPSLTNVFKSTSSTILGDVQRTLARKSPPSLVIDASSHNRGYDLEMKMEPDMILAKHEEEEEIAGPEDISAPSLQKRPRMSPLNPGEKISNSPKAAHLPYERFPIKSEDCDDQEVQFLGDNRKHSIFSPGIYSTAPSNTKAVVLQPRSPEPDRIPQSRTYISEH